MEGVAVAIGEGIDKLMAAVDAGTVGKHGVERDKVSAGRKDMNGIDERGGGSVIESPEISLTAVANRIEVGRVGGDNAAIEHLDLGRKTIVGVDLPAAEPGIGDTDTGHCLEDKRTVVVVVIIGLPYKRESATIDTGGIYMEGVGYRKYAVRIVFGIPTIVKAQRGNEGVFDGVAAGTGKGLHRQIENKVGIGEVPPLLAVVSAKLNLDGLTVERCEVDTDSGPVFP